MKIFSSFWSKFHKLHLGLYVLFALMTVTGRFTAYTFEKYSLVDTDLLKQEWTKIEAARAKGGSYVPSDESAKKIFKPISLRKTIRKTWVDGKLVKKTDYEESLPTPWYYFAFLAAWLWPLYRYNFGGKAALDVIERRIVHLPVVVFALTCALAVQSYFVKLAAYTAQYGAPTTRERGILIVSALLFAAFVSYLNLELTGLYIRGRIAKPFFMRENPYGAKHGFAINLTLRYALMIFSLAMVPLFLAMYVPIAANKDIWLKLAETTGSGWAWTINYEVLHDVLPILIVAGVCGVMLVFQALSIILYRYNVHAPLSALVKRMKAVAAGDFDCKTSVLYNDELGQLKGHFNMMLDGLVERDHIKDTFGRYVSLEIAEKIMKSGKVNLAGEEIQATVLFSDIRGFTPLSEKLPPKDLIRFLNEYFAYITVPIAGNKGVINKFIGDAVMAIFSPVFGVEDHKAAAVRAALGMRAALKEFNALGRYPEVAFGVGVHSGGLVAGNVGTEARLEYTVLGDTVNVASRIESHTKTAGTEILLSEAVMSGLDRSQFAGINFIEGEPVLMKGKSKPLVLYKVGPAA